MRSATDTTRSTPSALPRTGPRHSVDQRRTLTSTVMKPLSCGFTAATGRTRRWTSGRFACFDQALEDVGLTRDEQLRRVLHDYFAWATTTTMSRYHHSQMMCLDGLHIPKWSWHGRVSQSAIRTSSVRRFNFSRLARLSGLDHAFGESRSLLSFFFLFAADMSLFAS